MEEGVFFEWLSNWHDENGGIQNKNKNKTVLSRTRMIRRSLTGCFEPTKLITNENHKYQIYRNPQT